MSNREEFERLVLSLDYDARRYPETSAWPGQYRQAPVQLAWEAWQARAAITSEQEQAVRSYISQVQFAIKNVPDVPASHIFACGCMGPLPECACARRDRLVREFMEVPK